MRSWGDSPCANLLSSLESQIDPRRGKTTWSQNVCQLSVQILFEMIFAPISRPVMCAETRAGSHSLACSYSVWNKVKMCRYIFVNFSYYTFSAGFLTTRLKLRWRCSGRSPDVSVSWNAQSVCNVTRPQFCTVLPLSQVVQTLERMADAVYVSICVSNAPAFACKFLRQCVESTADFFAFSWTGCIWKFSGSLIIYGSSW
jgi:hypothetical protein